MNENSPKMTEPKDKDKKTLLPFLVVWLGQLISVFGSALTSFALGLFVYQSSGSVAQFSLISFFIAIPHVFFAPIAGVVADKYSRKTVMIVSDVGAGITTLIIALLLFTNNFALWHVYAAALISSTMSAFQIPAYSAAITLMIPKKHYGRASGLIQAGSSLAAILAPGVAGSLLVFVDLEGILVIDFITFIVAVTALFLTKVQDPIHRKDSLKLSFLSELQVGWRYITSQPSLLALLLFFASLNLIIAASQVLLVPLLLSFTKPNTLGAVISISSVGLLLGSITMTIWGGPKNQIEAILYLTMLQGFMLILTGLRQNLFIIVTATFIFLFILPIVGGCSQAIWQTKVAPEIQGRVFAARGAIARVSLPLAYLIAGH